MKMCINALTSANRIISILHHKMNINNTYRVSKYLFFKSPTVIIWLRNIIRIVCW